LSTGTCTTATRHSSCSMPTHVCYTSHCTDMTMATFSRGQVLRRSVVLIGVLASQSTWRGLVQWWVMPNIWLHSGTIYFHRWCPFWCYWRRRAGVKGEMLLLLEVQLWMKKGWGQATGYDWCFVFPYSALTLMVGSQKGHPARKKARSTNPKRFSSSTGGGGGFKGNWLTQMHLENGY